MHNALAWLRIGLSGPPHISTPPSAQISENDMEHESQSEETLKTRRKSAALTAVITIALGASAQQPGLKGIEVADMDRSVKPCDNFYDYANGTWRANNPIPSYMDRWSRRWQAGEVNKDQLRKILDEISSGPAQPKGSPAQLTGDFYAACTNTKAIGQAKISSV